MTGQILNSLLMPTRGRPQRALRFLQSVRETASVRERVEIILYVDEDDPGSHGIADAALDMQVIIGPRQSMGANNGACFERARGDIIILVNDDVVIRTPGWDEQIRALDAAVADRIYLGYGNDEFKRRRLCTFPILSRRACRVLQEPYHHAYRGAFIDYHLMDIFKRLKRAGYDRIFYLPEVVFEHLHFRAGKASIDETYTARGRFDDDMLFIGLARVRAASLSLLVATIEDEPVPPGGLPAYQAIDKPASLWRAVKLFTRIFLTDGGLPLGWRLFMWWWFSARYVASRVTYPGGGMRKRNDFMRSAQ
jgi:glycosyltransferase involved in cell wall biosynthesis